MLSRAAPVRTYSLEKKTDSDAMQVPDDDEQLGLEVGVVLDQEHRAVANNLIQTGVREPA